MNMNRLIAFDIETGPASLEELSLMEVPFDPATVKIGNLKDQVKIEEKIEAARKNHELDFINKAALSPFTGRVIAIGWADHFHGCQSI